MVSNIYQTCHQDTSPNTVAYHSIKHVMKISFNIQGEHEIQLIYSIYVSRRNTQCEASYIPCIT